MRSPNNSEALTYVRDHFSSYGSIPPVICGCVDSLEHPGSARDVLFHIPGESPVYLRAYRFTVWFEESCPSAGEPDVPYLYGEW